MRNQGGSKMKKTLFGVLFCALALIAPMSAMARVDVHVSIPLPPPIVFTAPPAAVVIPETYIYAFPDVREEIFFCDGWWWRQWDGRWYRSRNHNSGWAHYHRAPAFYSKVPAGWRNDYRNNHWKGHYWKHQRVSSDQLKDNWKHWERNKYWEKRHNWGVKKAQVPPQHRRSQELRHQGNHGGGNERADRR
ncbi:hypothetical membrane protein [Syntrophus aciditrophicus SB]|uniref:Hypothetical membrane protein n=2 Tax=Syntrophus TaxID=43773 RepID=Q2LRE4_SYNAS|nr:hypothetical membrane protein [Syntrophus aciditrophicus SB]